VNPSRDPEIIAQFREDRRRERGLQASESSSAEEKVSPVTKVSSVTLDQILKGFQWSESCVAFFNHVMKDAPPDAHDPAVGLSAQWFFLQLLIHGGEQRKGSGYTTEALFKACGKSVETLRKLQESTAQRNVHPQSGGIFLNPSLAAILVASGDFGRGIASDQIVAIRHLVAAFIFKTTNDGRLLWYLGLEAMEISDVKLLRAFRDHIEKKVEDTTPDGKIAWAKAIELINNLLRGRKMRFTRDAEDNEGCLQVNSYAELLATLMRQSDDREFNLAIYGHWGRGKTYLMKRTAEALRKTPENDPREFETVTFSAWQYPSRPEVWIHLYETFAQAAFDKGLKSLPTVVRAGVARHGYWKLLFAYLLGAVALLPVVTKIELITNWAVEFYAVVGTAGLLLLSSFYRAVKGAHKRLKAEYLTAARHAEKLGLQATIGEDLEALLKGWMPTVGCGWRFYLSYTGISLFAAGALWWRLRDIGTHLPLANASASLMLVVSGLMCWWLFPWTPRSQKVLLVVDDLDRCDPGHLLSVMESIKLLLEKPEVSRRVLVTMLIEEDILKHAIWQKYSHLADEDAGKELGTSFNGDRISRENCEKLFTVHLRLPELQGEEIRAIVDHFAPEKKTNGAGKKEGKKENSSTNTEQGKTNKEQTGAAAAKIDVKAAELYLDANRTNATNQLAYGQIILGHEEREAIAAELETKRDGRDHIAPLGPRAIRAFIFRYQLARLILANLGIKTWRPSVLIAALAESLFERPETPQKRKDLEPEVEVVVRQVT
jgi:hypothetical protein